MWCKRQEDSEPRAGAKLSHPPCQSNDQDDGSCFCKLWRKRKLSPSIMRMWLRCTSRSKRAAVICSLPKTCVHWAKARFEVIATLERSYRSLKNGKSSSAVGLEKGK